MLPAVSGQVGKHNHEIRFRAKIIARAVMGVNGGIERGGASAHGRCPAGIKEGVMGITRPSPRPS